MNDRKEWRERARDIRASGTTWSWYFLGKSNIFNYVSTCQTRSYDFWFMNARCTFMYLFVVYFSFAPVISASIHHYVNYFDIQVLMMVTETETLTSTSHHNIPTYLDYIFSDSFILSDFNLSLLSYIYIYIYILSLLGILLRWGFLIWELIFLLRTFVLILVFFVLFISLSFGQISPLIFYKN